MKTVHTTRIAVLFLAFCLVPLTGCQFGKEYSNFVTGFWTKVDELAKADQINQTLKNRIAILEEENVKLKSELGENAEHHKAEELKGEALHEGGSVAARTEHSLVPEMKEEASHEKEEDGEDLSIMALPPKKIFLEAMKAFGEKAFDRSARGFIALANHKTNKIYNTAQVNYMAGVSLFELHNYARAQSYFKKSYELAAGRNPASVSGERSVYAARSLSWIAVCHQKLGHKKEAKETIQELFNYFPHSAEAKRFH